MDISDSRGVRSVDVVLRRLRRLSPLARGAGPRAFHPSSPYLLIVSLSHHLFVVLATHAGQ